MVASNLDLSSVVDEARQLSGYPHRLRHERVWQVAVRYTSFLFSGRCYPGFRFIGLSKWPPAPKLPAATDLEICFSYSWLGAGEVGG